MSPLTQAISQGFSPDQVIEFLLRKFPKYAKDIQKAMGKGYSASQVLQYLNGRKGNRELEGALTEHEKARLSDKEKQRNIEKNLGKGALAVGAAGLGIYGLGRGAQAVIPEVLTAMEGIANPKEGVEIDLTPKIGHQAKQLEFQPPNQLIQQSRGPKNPINPQSPPNASPQVPHQSPSNTQPQAPKMDFGQILEQIGVKHKVDALRGKNPPDIISKVIKYGFSKDQFKQLEAELQVPIEQVISGYLQSAPPIEENIPTQNIQKNQPMQSPKDNLGFGSAFGSLKGGGTTEQLYEGVFKSLQEGKNTFAGIKDPLIAKAKPFYDRGLIKSPEDLKKLANEGFNKEKNTLPDQVAQNTQSISQDFEEPSNKEKVKEIGSSVLFPDGKIGKIDSIKQGIAKVNVDGKDRHKNLDELIESPLPEKDLSDIYTDVLSEIKKETGQEVSRNVYWAGYDPNTNELAFIPHLGSLYVYKDISPEDSKELTSFLTQRKTTGENFIGAWEAGSKSPIGAAMSALIQRLQKTAGKGKEYSRKYEKIYDALEPAKLAAKRKYDLEKKAAKPVKEKKTPSKNKKREEEI